VHYRFSVLTVNIETLPVSTPSSSDLGFRLAAFSRESSSARLRSDFPPKCSPSLFISCQFLSHSNAAAALE